MMTAKCLRRQAATCADLAMQTDDDESRERYLRLQRLYLQLADSEDGPHDRADTFTGDSKTSSDGKTESPAHLPH